ncbi:MAG: TolC family protein, partial [Victivallaceae bacterium]|nr:TolC family protein [Victivallaceae bacterium]
TQSWWEIGVHAAYNLLKLPQQIAKYRALNSEVDEIAMRTLALSIGVMAQVRIAHANILEVKERYELDDKAYQAYKKHLKVASQTFASGGALSKLELDRYELETAETFINRLISMSSCYVSYYRLLNTLGVNSLDPATIEIVMREVKRSEAKQRARELSKITVVAYVDLAKELKYNGVVLGNNTASEEKRGKFDALVAQAAKVVKKKKL